MVWNSAANARRLTSPSLCSCNLHALRTELTCWHHRPLPHRNCASKRFSRLVDMQLWWVCRLNAFQDRFLNTRAVRWGQTAPCCHWVSFAQNIWPVSGGGRIWSCVIPYFHLWWYFSVVYVIFKNNVKARVCHPITHANQGFGNKLGNII